MKKRLCRGWKEQTLNGRNMTHTIYAYPSKQRPDLPKKKFKGLTRAEMEAKHRELLKEGYTKINIEK